MMNVNVKLVNKEMVERYLRMLDDIELNNEGKVVTDKTADEISCCVQAFDVVQDPQIQFEAYNIDENAFHFWFKVADSKVSEKTVMFDKEDIKQMDVEWTNKKYPRSLKIKGVE